MSLNIPAIADKLNQLARPHPIGKLQDIRTQLKKLSRRPGDKIFSTHTIFDEWAFHHGGRTELQFNIGYADGENSDYLRYGVAFSFELSQTLKSIDVLVPKVKFFNDFIALNAGDFSDMRMWHYDENGRSEDRPPGPIPSALVTEHVFVFMGNRQPPKKIEYAATGFLAVHRKVIDALIYSGRFPLCHADKPWSFWPLFQPITAPMGKTNAYLSEDWSFCLQAAP